MSALAASLLEKIETRRARTGVVGLGYVGLPLAVELAKAGFHTTGIDLDQRKIERHHGGALLHPRRAERRRQGAARRGQARRDHRLRHRQGARHHQHLRADAAAQDQGPGHVLHRVGGRGDRQAPAPGHADRPRVDHLSRARPTKSCSRCSKRPGSRPASTSSSRSRPSASTRATRPSRPTTCRRSSAA